MSLLSPTLEAFWAIVQTGTVQKASYILKITQTGVTQRIRTLEKELKVNLFIRSRTGMKLTPEGQSLLEYVKFAIDFEGVTLSKIQNTSLNHNIELRISGPTSFLQSRVTPFLFSLQEKYENLFFSIYENSALTNEESLVKQLKSYEVDFILTEQDSITREMHAKKLNSLNYNLYSFNKLTSFNNQSLNFKIILIKSDLDFYKKFCKASKNKGFQSFKNINIVDSLSTAFNLLKAPQTAFFTTSTITDLYLKKLSPRSLYSLGQPYEITPYLVTHKAKKFSPCKEDLLKLIK